MTQGEVDDFLLWTARVQYREGALDGALLAEIESDIRARTAPALHLVSAETN